MNYQFWPEKRPSVHPETVGFVRGVINAMPLGLLLWTLLFVAAQLAWG